MVDTQKRAHIVDINGGALIEEIDAQLGKIVENLLDPNTDYKKARTMTITLKFTNDDERREVTRCEATTKVSLVHSKPVVTQMVFGMEGGEMAAVEIARQVPGQMGIDGSVEAQPPIIVVGGKKHTVDTNTGELTEEVAENA